MTIRLLVIIACAALYPYQDDGCGEIACIVSHPDYRGGQRGQRLLALLEQEARRLELERVFVLTTQTAHWFIELMMLLGWKQQNLSSSRLNSCRAISSPATSRFCPERRTRSRSQ